MKKLSRDSWAAFFRKKFSFVKKLCRTRSPVKKRGARQALVRSLRIQPRKYIEVSAKATICDTNANMQV